MKKGLLLISLGLFTSFILFSYFVHKGHFASTDFDLTVKLQDHLSRKVDIPFSILTLFGSVEITSLVWVGILIYTVIRRFWKTFLSMFLFLFSLMTELYGKVFVYHPAPPFMFYRGALKFAFPSSYITTNYSYPSGHATRVTFLIVFIMVYLLLRKRLVHQFAIQLGFVVFLILMYVSRVYLGEHWTSDVIGGALLGGSLGILSGLTIPQRIQEQPLQKT